VCRDQCCASFPRTPAFQYLFFSWAAVGRIQVIVRFGSLEGRVTAKKRATSSGLRTIGSVRGSLTGALASRTSLRPKVTRYTNREAERVRLS
jgi:hypothetical protein